jgi:hypothetical protein
MTSLLATAPIAWSSQASLMQIPDSPEALFEVLADSSLRELYPRFDELEPRNQKMVRLLHTELTKGELTDHTFQQFVGFVLVLWRSFNHSVLISNALRIETEDEIDTDWVDAATHLARLDQYLIGLLATLESLPGLDPDSDKGPSDTRYLLSDSASA